MSEAMEFNAVLQRPDQLGPPVVRIGLAVRVDHVALDDVATPGEALLGDPLVERPPGAGQPLVRAPVRGPGHGHGRKLARIDTILQRYRDVTVDDIGRVARSYLSIAPTETLATADEFELDQESRHSPAKV
jgi:hypothetical protein